MPVIEVYESSRGRPVSCSGSTCRALIVWVQTFGRSRKLPLNAHAVAQQTRTDPLTGAIIGLYDTADTHWSTCPDRAEFVKRRRTGDWSAGKGGEP